MKFVSHLCSETLFLEASYVAVTRLFRGSWDRAMHFAALQGGGRLRLRVHLRRVNLDTLLALGAQPCTTFHGSTL